MRRLVTVSMCGLALAAGGLVVGVRMLSASPAHASAKIARRGHAPQAIVPTGAPQPCFVATGCTIHPCIEYVAPGAIRVPRDLLPRGKCTPAPAQAVPISAR